MSIMYRYVQTHCTYTLLFPAVATLASLTGDFGIGFGSFVDKPVVPFVPRVSLMCVSNGTRGGNNSYLTFSDHFLEMSDQISAYTCTYNSIQVSDQYYLCVQAIISTSEYMYVYVRTCTYYIANVIVV